MLKIILNSIETTLKQSLSLTQLLQQQGYENKTCAVSINKTFVPKSEYETTIINENDRVDIVQPIAGG